MIIHGNEENFNELISSGEVLVDFFATWCGPCQMLAPILEDLSKENEDFEIVKIDIDQAFDLAIKHKVDLVPTMIIFKNGNEMNRMTGVLDKNEILEKIEQYK